jgi:hypothetical protein
VSETKEHLSTDTITATLFLSLSNARARGEPWKALAEEYLGPAVLLLKRINRMRAALLQRQEQPARRLQKMNTRILPLLETFADALWQQRGHDQRDPVLTVLAPGTPNFFFEWQLGQPPDRLDVLLDVLTGDSLSNTQTEATRAAAGKILALLPEYRVLCEDMRSLSAQLAILDKAADTIAPAGHVQHSRLRRRMRADGFDPFEVRRVFPDIPGVSISDTWS